MIYFPKAKAFAWNIFLSRKQEAVQINQGRDCESELNGVNTYFETSALTFSEKLNLRLLVIFILKLSS